MRAAFWLSSWALSALPRIHALLPALLDGLLCAWCLCSKWMQQQMEIAAHWGVYTYNKELRDLVAIGAACGVTAAFKAPVRHSAALLPQA